MKNDDFYEIRKLLQHCKLLEAQINSLPDFDGTPEVKELRSGRYVYMRKRVNGKLTSRYVDRYSEDLYNKIILGTRYLRLLKTKLQEIRKQLENLGFSREILSEEILRNIHFACENKAENIRSLAMLNGTDISLTQILEIIENRRIYGVYARDISLILNLKSAWEFITDKDIAHFKTDSRLLLHIANLVNGNVFRDSINAEALPDLKKETCSLEFLPTGREFKENIDRIIYQDSDPVDTAIKLFLFCSGKRFFVARNKLISLLFANRFLICSGAGLLTVPADDAPEFRELLAGCLATGSHTELEKFIKDKCLKRP